MNEIQDYLLKTQSAKHWEKIRTNNHHGFVIPLFSIRTKNNQGIGEFLDLKLVIDWCSEIGFDIIQLLPLNDSSLDPSPYNAISSCALNPIYLSLNALKGIENTKIYEKINQLKIFNDSNRVEYDKLRILKMDLLKEYFEEVFTNFKNNENYQNFTKTNSWLDEYTIFKTLLELNKDRPWDKWPKEDQNIDETKLSIYKEKYKTQIDFYTFVQFLCFEQMQEVKKYSDDKNIFLLGDLPILLSKNSSDVWYNKKYFDLDMTAGAPPDAYNKYGQKWNFPLFNWQELKKDNFSWWQRRLNLLSNFYHLYRIDHTVGFFRIWAMHLKEHPKSGKYLPEDASLWQSNGKERLLMMLNFSNLLPIAEDLGTIPSIVYETLKELGICGTKVVFWQKRQNEFIKFNDYEPLSITTLSTHDSYTFELWWENSKDDAKKFAQLNNFKYEKKLSYEQRKELLKKVHKTPSIFHINLLQEYLALYPELIWPRGEDERINIPGKILKTNWTYRYRPYFEDIMNHKNLNKDLKELL